MSQGARLVTVDGDRLTAEIGNPKVLNTLLLGAAIGQQALPSPAKKSARPSPPGSNRTSPKSTIAPWIVASPTVRKLHVHEKRNGPPSPPNLSASRSGAPSTANALLRLIWPASPAGTLHHPALFRKGRSAPSLSARHPGRARPRGGAYPFLLRHHRYAGHHPLHRAGRRRLGDHVARCYAMIGCTAEDRIHITPGYGLWMRASVFRPGRKNSARWPSRWGRAIQKNSCA